MAVRAQKHGEDEIGVLIDSFNEMLRRKSRSAMPNSRVARVAADRAKSGQEQFPIVHEPRTGGRRSQPSSVSAKCCSPRLRSEDRREWADDLRRVHDSGKYLLELIMIFSTFQKSKREKLEWHLETSTSPALVRTSIT